MRGLYAGETTKYKQLNAIERGKIEAYLSERRSISQKNAKFQTELMFLNVKNYRKTRAFWGF